MKCKKNSFIVLLIVISCCNGFSQVSYKAQVMQLSKNMRDLALKNGETSQELLIYSNHLKERGQKTNNQIWIDQAEKRIAIAKKNKEMAIEWNTIADNIAKYASNELPDDRFKEYFNNLNPSYLSLKNDMNTLVAQLNEAKATEKYIDEEAITLFMRLFCCDKTTEPSADEVYILVMGQRDDGVKYFNRSPAENFHWDMNDGDQPTNNSSGDSHCITDKVLFSGGLADGHTWWLNVVIAEEDGGTSRAYQAAAAKLLTSIEDPYAAAAGTIIGAMTALGFNITDSDDWMGMFGVKITNNNGSMNVTWTSKEGIFRDTSDPDQPSNPNKKEYRMNHDGTNYVGWFGVR